MKKLLIPNSALLTILVAFYFLLSAFNSASAAESVIGIDFKCNSGYVTLHNVQNYLSYELKKSGWLVSDGDCNYVISVKIDSLLINSDLIEFMSFDLKFSKHETVLHPGKTYTEHLNISYNAKTRTAPAPNITAMEKNIIKGEAADRQFDVASVIYDRVLQWYKQMDK
jgi:hypothetical protein